MRRRWNLWEIKVNDINWLDDNRWRVKDHHKSWDWYRYRFKVCVHFRLMKNLFCTHNFAQDIMRFDCTSHHLVRLLRITKWWYKWVSTWVSKALTEEYERYLLGYGGILFLSLSLINISSSSDFWHVYLNFMNELNCIHSLIEWEITEIVALILRFSFN